MDWEFYILNYIQNNFKTDWMDKLMVCVSLIGTLSLIWVLIGVVCLSFRQTRKLGRSLACSLILNLVVGSLIIKLIVGRIRPCVLNNTVDILVKIPIDPSFPSGHTMQAFAASTIIFIYNKWLGLLAFAFSCLMAFSRMYLYVHFPTDVMSGAIFGIIFAIIAYKIEKMISTPELKVLPKKQ